MAQVEFVDFNNHITSLWVSKPHVRIPLSLSFTESSECFLYNFLYVLRFSPERVSDLLHFNEPETCNFIVAIYIFRRESGASGAIFQL